MFFSRIRILVCLVCVSVVIVALLMVINTTASNLIASVLGSIVASIFVSGLYNHELHESLDKYNRIGLINFFDNYEDAHELIKKKIEVAKNVDVFVMYGDSFVNTSTKAIQSLLARDSTTFRFFLYAESNKFIESYGYHWGESDNNEKYKAEGLRTKVRQIKSDLTRLASNKNTKCTFEVFEIQHSPISYSFYKIDDEMFFVPSKNVKSKEIKPFVFHCRKTTNKSAIYNKVAFELDAMISNKEVIKMTL